MIAPTSHTTDEHTWFSEAAAAFVERHIWPRRTEMREAGRIPREIWLQAGADGFLGLGIPEEHGGAGSADFRFNALFQEQLTHPGLAYASAFGIHTDVVAPYLVELTTDEQKQRWLPRFCRGELITAIAMTEPEVGSDLAALRTSATRDASGWRLNGSKTFITNGTQADLVIVAARTGEAPGGRGISLFALEEGAPGFTRGPRLHKVGQHEADTAELFFDNVPLEPDSMLGQPGTGFMHMMERLPQERLSVACANVAHAAWALAATIAYARERIAFGQPIGSFQHNRFRLAEMVTEIEVTRAYVDGCLDRHVCGKLSAVDAAKAKWWTAEVQNRVLDGCVQLFGGYGYMEEYEVARAWADARVTKVWAGTNEIMKEVIGRSLGFGDPRPA